jgi:hypothetical protein
MMGFGRAREYLSGPVDGSLLCRSKQLPTVDIPEPIVLLLLVPLPLPSYPGRTEVVVGVIVSPA